MKTYRPTRLLAALSLLLLWSIGAQQTTSQAALGALAGPQIAPQVAAANPARIIIVAKQGGQFKSIQAALNSIKDATWERRYLISVAPGYYAETVYMKPYIDIQGSGEGLTIIYSEPVDSCNAPVVYGAANAQLRFLTVQQAGSSLTDCWSAGLFYRDIHPNPQAVDRTGANLLHVTVVVDHTGTAFGIYSANSDLFFEHVTVHTTAGRGAYGLSSQGSFIHVRDSEINAEGIQGTTGIYIISPSGGTLWLDDSRVKVIARGGSHTVALMNSTSFAEVTGSTLVIEDDGVAPSPNHLLETHGGTTRINFSLLVSTIQLEQPVFGGNNWLGASRVVVGTIPLSAGCAGVYDENWTFYANTCP